MPQLGFHVDMSACMGCHTCAVACQDRHDLPAGQRFRRVVEVSGGAWATPPGGAPVPHVFAYYISISCNHCEKPMCVANCPTGALSKRPQDGVVTIDQKVCIGCRYCAWSCPYGAPQYSPQKGKSQKCDLCVDLLQRGKDPACVSACPSRAIHVGPVDDLRLQFAGSMDLHGLPDPKLTTPNALYTPHKDAVRRERP